MWGKLVKILEWVGHGGTAVQIAGWVGLPTAGLLGFVVTFFSSAVEGWSPTGVWIASVATGALLATLYAALMIGLAYRRSKDGGGTEANTAAPFNAESILIEIAETVARVTDGRNIAAAIKVTNLGPELERKCIVHMEKHGLGNLPDPFVLRTENQIRRSDSGRFTLSKGQPKIVPILLKSPGKNRFYIMDEQGTSYGFQKDKLNGNIVFYGSQDSVSVAFSLTRDSESKIQLRILSNDELAVTSSDDDAPNYKSAFDAALLQNPERVKSSPLYVKLKYNFEPKAGYKSPASQVTDGKIEFQKLYDRARNKDLESYLIAGHMAEWLRENARFCYASSTDFFDVLEFIETRMDDLHAIFRNERPAGPKGARLEHQISSLTNEELVEYTIRFASQLRKFETNSMAEVMDTGRTRRNLPALAFSMESAFRDTYMIPAKLLREEITSRLNRIGIFPEPKGPYGSPLLAFDGHLAGPSAVSDAADYLEISARRLL